MAAPLAAAAKKIAVDKAMSSKAGKAIIAVIVLLPIALFVGLIALVLFFISNILETATNASTCTPETCVVSEDDQINAQILVEGVANGSIKTWPTHVFEKQIQPIALGEIIPGCEIDSRVLQTLVLTYQEFGSMTISDINRPCIGSDLNCPFSPHCAHPAQAIDFALIGGSVVTGANQKSVEFLNFFHSFAPENTFVGQVNCRGNFHAWPKFTQFNDSCDHIHIDFRGNNLPLQILPPSVPELPSTPASTD